MAPVGAPGEMRQHFLGVTGDRTRGPAVSLTDYGVIVT